MNKKDIMTKWQMIYHHWSRTNFMSIKSSENGKWQPSTVLTKCAEPRSYILECPDEASKRQNRVQIREIETADHKHVPLNNHVTSLPKKQNIIPKHYNTKTTWELQHPHHHNHHIFLLVGGCNSIIGTTFLHTLM